MIKILYSSDETFEASFAHILERGATQSSHVETIVRNILADVRQNGESALLDGVSKFDGWNPKDSTELLINEKEFDSAYNSLDNTLKNALKTAFSRIETYHQKLKPTSWFDYEQNGAILGQKVTPMERAGLYIPGGKAAYPSSLLMNAVPALVAGVDEIIVCTPTPHNEPNTLLLAACKLCGLKNVFKVGGAYAIAAMAYGAGAIKKVDVITGPGNIFVATAKKLVYGDVNIDMVAGPSEIGVIADESADADTLAIDLLSQAEHDEMASSIMITTSKELALQTAKSIDKRLLELKRNEISSVSINQNGAIIVTDSIEKAVALMNLVAPEHLEVCTKNPFDLLPHIKHAGAIFLGHNTPEAIGDYVAGPNHTLPTGGSARFFSPLSTEHFMKKSSIISFSKEALSEHGAECAMIASVEGLVAHERSILDRLERR